MSDENDPGEQRRTTNKLRMALFDYFLWSLPVGTPAATIGALADHVLTEAKDILKRFKETNLT